MKIVTTSKRFNNILITMGISHIVSNDYDYIDIDDEDHSIITFLPTNRVSTDKDPWIDGRNKIKIGRFLKSLLGVDDYVIENLSNRYKSLYYLETNQYDKIFDIVQGKDISYWYDYRKYISGGGTLNSSCMRGAGEERLELYTTNPKSVKLLIIKQGDKLAARALMWNTDIGIYIDRPYCRYDNDHFLYQKYAEKNEFLIYFKDYRKRMRVVIKNKVIQYPYLDTFKMESNGGMLTCKNLN